jgi:Predicted metal-dependent hydrolase
MIILNDNLNIEIFNPPKLMNDHEEEIESAVSEFIKAFKIKEVNLDISFCSIEEIKELNKKFRNNDKPTNVLSFPRYSISGN